MKNPTKFFGPLTWVGWLNYLILQWLFVRLAYDTKDHWFILKWIVPKTGWGEGKFKYVGRDKCGKT